MVIGEVSNRIAVMERSILKLRAVVFTLMTIQMLWLLSGAAQQDERSVSRFTIVDGTGKPRIEMRTDDAGNPSIAFMDAGGSERLSIMLDERGSELYLRGSHGRGIATLQALSDGAAWLMLDGGSPKSEGPNIRMTATSDPEDVRQQYSEIIVANPVVESSVRIASQSHGSEVSIVKDGVEPVALHIDDDGASGLTISDARDRKPFERIKLLLDPNGQPKFQILNKDGQEIRP